MRTRLYRYHRSWYQLSPMLVLSLFRCLSASRFSSAHREKLSCLLLVASAMFSYCRGWCSFIKTREFRFSGLSSCGLNDWSTLSTFIWVKVMIGALPTSGDGESFNTLCTVRVSFDQADYPSFSSDNRAWLPRNSSRHTTSAFRFDWEL